MPNQKHNLKVFLSHASADKPMVRRIYQYLIRRGIQPWFDEVELLPGQEWEFEISNALETSDAIIVFLSKNSVNKEGFVQREFKFAVERALEMPEGRIFLIPARLDDCDVPRNLRKYQWVNLFDGGQGYERLMRALKLRAEQLQRNRVETFRPEMSTPLSLPPLGLPNRSETEPLPHQAPKPFWQKTELLVAIIGAIATVIAALIGILPSLVPPASTPTVTASATIAPVTSPPTIPFTATASFTPTLLPPTATATSTARLSATPSPTLTPSFPTLAWTLTPTPTVTPTASPTIPPEKIISFGYKNLKALALWRFNSPVYGVDISPDNRWVVSGERNGRITVSTVPDGGLFKQYDYGSSIYDLSFSPDGRWLAVAGEGGEILVLDTATWDKPLLLSGHTGAVNTLDFSADSTFLVSGGLDGTVRIWDVAGWVQRLSINVSRRVYAVDVDPAGERVAVGASDGVIRVWTTAGALAYTLESADGPSQSIISLDFSPSGDLLITASSDPANPYQVWDTQTRRLKLEFGSGLLAKGMSFSPDGQVIVTNTNDRQLALWRASTGARLAYFDSAHQDAIWAAVFSRDGTWLVSASSDKTIRLWGIP